jgi:hypothetical protein
MKSALRTGLWLLPLFLFGLALGSVQAADWSVSMKVILNDTEMTPLPLEWGCKSGATDLFDPGLDVIAPLSTPDGDDAYLLSIVNQESPYNKLLKDFRGLSNGSTAWHIVLRLAPGKKMRLDWSGTTLPAGATLLIQEADGQWQGVGPLNNLAVGGRFLEWSNDTDELRTERYILHKQ